MARVQAGDNEAFGALVVAYQDRVYNMILRMVSHPDDAADLTQEVFLTVYQKIGSFRGKSQFYTWLYRIAANVALSLLRRRKVSREVPDPPESEALREGRSEGPSAHIERDERARQVQAALDALDDEFRTVVVLRDIEDLAYDEIGAILDIPEGTVKSRLSRAREALRERLKEVLG